MHFSVLVIGDDVEDKMEPYGIGEEGSKYFEFCLEISADRVEHEAKRLAEEIKQRPAIFSLEDMLRIEAMLMNGKYAELLCTYNGYEIDGDGNLGYMMNPRAMWDWYEAGGLYSDILPVLPSAESTYAVQVRDIDTTRPIEAYAVIDEAGEWHDIVDTDVYEKFLKHLPPDTHITIVDCHY